MYLLDTNVVSELRRTDRADRNVLAWAAVEGTRASISVITIFELDLGQLRLARRDPRQADILRDWIENRVLRDFGPRILPIDLAVVRRAAALHVPDPRPDRDALIAATALTHGLTIITRNAADFAPMGVPVLNPWNARA